MFYTSLEIASEINNLVKVEDFIETLMNDFAISDDYKGILTVPLIEAVTNAILHGNHSDKHKKVSINCQLSNKQLTFSVSDEGKGFDFNQILSEKLENRKSSGLTSIELLCEDIEFLNNGSTIVFSINIPLHLSNEREISVLSGKEVKQDVKTIW
jgi:serine/threonine-protein kinase RsbW